MRVIRLRILVPLFVLATPAGLLLCSPSVTNVLSVPAAAATEDLWDEDFQKLTNTLKKDGYSYDQDELCPKEFKPKRFKQYWIRDSGRWKLVKQSGMLLYHWRAVNYTSIVQSTKEVYTLKHTYRNLTRLRLDLSGPQEQDLELPIMDKPGHTRITWKITATDELSTDAKTTEECVLVFAAFEVVIDGKVKYEGINPMYASFVHFYKNCKRR